MESRTAHEFFNKIILKVKINFRTNTRNDLKYFPSQKQSIKINLFLFANIILGERITRNFYLLCILINGLPYA